MKQMARAVVRLRGVPRDQRGPLLKRAGFHGEWADVFPADVVLDALRELLAHTLAVGPIERLLVDADPATLDELQIALTVETEIARDAMAAEGWSPETFIGAWHRLGE